MRGDITLNAVEDTGAITIPTPTLGITGTPSSATLSSGVYLLSSLGEFKVKVNPASDTFPSGVKYVWQIGVLSGDSVPATILSTLETSQEITINSAMLASMGINNIDDISTNSSNPTPIIVQCRVKHDSLPSNEWKACSPLQIKISQPPEYKYSLKYPKADGTFAPIGTTNQDQEFTPGSQIYFGGQTAPLTMGKLDSSLTGVEAAIQIDGWTGTGPNGNSLSYGAFPNPGPADCTSDGSGGYSIELIATTNPDLGTFYNNCRANSNAVQNGDVVLSTGLCVDKTYYANNRTFLDPYVVGTVCIRDGNQKFVVAKSSDSVNDKYWSNAATADISGLQVSVTGTNTGDVGTPLYDVAAAPTITNISGKDSYATIQNAGIANINSYEPFVYCHDYHPSGVTTGSYSNSWYLPSLIEAIAINQYRGTFNANLFGVSNPWFMTSSQYTQSQYWYIQGGSNAGTGTITAKNKTISDTNIEVYPCHELNFTAPPQ